MEVPPLEPLESSQQEAALRRRILILQQRVQSRIAQPDRERLSSAERKTLEDARTFLAQSARALEQGDLQRALTLASKASQLVGSLEEAR